MNKEEFLKKNCKCGVFHYKCYMSKDLNALIASERAEEREECAKIAEKHECKVIFPEPKEINRIFEDLADYLFHKIGCENEYANECDCGLNDLITEMEAIRNKGE